MKPDTGQERNESFTLLLYSQFPVEENTTVHAAPLRGSTGVGHKTEEGTRTVGKHHSLVSIGMGKAE